VPQHWISGVFFAWGVNPCQKWWWSLLEREISCSQWEGPNMHSKRLVFFPFMFWGVGGGEERFFFIFPDFPMCSHYVPFKFPMGSQYFPQHFFHTSSLLYALENGVLLSPIWVAKRGGIVQFKIKSSVLGSLHYFFFFGVMGQSNWHVAPKKKLRRHLL